MKVKHIVVIFLIGLILLIVGTTFKILHWPYAGIIITTSLLLKVVAGVSAIWKIVTMNRERLKEFLNS